MKNKKIIYMLLAFTIPIFMFLLVMYLKIGDIDGNYILIADMKSQYVSLFQYLKNVLNGTESPFYSFHKGLGGGNVYYVHILPIKSIKFISILF